jgi:hypothetical protein
LELLRVLWRVERRKDFGVQIIQAALYAHPHGQERRVFIEPEEAGNLLHSELARIDFDPLWRKAVDLRDVLLGKGWSALQSTTADEGST